MTDKPFRFAYCQTIISIFLITIGTSLAFANDGDDKTLSPYFYVEGKSTDRLPLKDTNVDIAISGVIADVKVTQTYRNEGKRPINATYIFPASTRAAVYAMRMRIGNELIIAKIKEKEVAKKEFEAAKKKGKSASLLEQERPNVFSMKMANLMPDEEIEVELRYTELLIPTKNVYEFVYPTVVGPRYSSDKEKKAAPKTEYLRKGEKPTSKLHLSARVSTGVPIQNIDCPSHKIAPNMISSSVGELKLDDSDPFTGNRDFILRYSLAGDEIESGLLLFEGEDENFFLYMAQPPNRVKTEDIPAREYVFVIDVSGSMYGFPIETSKQLIRNLIGGLGPNDYFNVVLFAGDSSVLSEKPLRANQENISRAIKLLDEESGYGGTELLGAMKRAMKLPKKSGVSRNVVVVTDGYIWGEEGVFQYIRENLHESNVFSFGIGSSVNRYLIEGIAKAGMGEPFVVTDEAEAQKTATAFREYIQSPLLTDIKVNAAGFETYDVFPVRRPDLLAERPIIVFGKWRGNVAGAFNLLGTTGSGAYSSKINVANSQPDDANRALRYLWARSRIAELSNYGFGENSDETVEAIKSIGLKYNLLTQYTSFIAVREVIRNPDGSADDVNQILPLPVGVGMAVGSEPEFVWLIFGLALIGIVLLIGRNRAMLLRAIANQGTTR